MKQLSNNKKCILPLIALGSLVMLCGQLSAVPQGDDAVDLLSMSIEDLMNVEVTSVSKKAEKFFDAAAAIYVVTHEDIRRSGATSIPEALRMVPGLQVANVSGNVWAISSRGFNSWYSNKLLVLIDGRSVYSSIFAGVYWNVQDVMLEDVDRIEVIRGPGGTLWGANAVNGVINVITRKASESQGLYVTGGGGTEELGFGGVRYGGKISEDAYFRVYTKYFDRDEQKLANGQNAPDQWDGVQSGFRLDWDCSAENLLTVQGDIYKTRFESGLAAMIGESEGTGGNVLGRFSHSFSQDSEMTLQVYYNRVERDYHIGLRTLTDIMDVDFQHHFSLDDRQDIVWGLGYRFSTDEIDQTQLYQIIPATRDLNLFSSFLQDKIQLSDTLSLTIGSKFEHNDHTGFEVQPNVRLSWAVHDRHVLWSAVSRAVRTPSRTDDDQRYPSGTWVDQSNIQYISQILGDRDVDSEELVAYELGYRFQPTDKVSLDFSAFFNDYDRLHCYNMHVDASNMPAFILVDNVFDNKMDGETYGAELVANWNVTDYWRLVGSYTFLQTQLHTDQGINDILSEGSERGSPHNQFNIRSLLNITDSLQFDTFLYYVDNVPMVDVDNYIKLDARLGWKVNDQVELSLVGQDLLDSQHAEFADTLTVNTSSEMQRRFYARLSLRF